MAVHPVTDPDVKEGFHTRADGLLPRVLRGAGGGVVAGLVLGIFTMLYSMSVGDSFFDPPRLISTIAIEEGTFGPDPSAALGLAIHFILSAVFGAFFGLWAALFRSNGTVAGAGFVYGALLYVFTYQVMARASFEQFMEGQNQVFQFAIHLIYGQVLAFAFYSTGKRRGEPVLDLAGTGHTHIEPAQGAEGHLPG